MPHDKHVIDYINKDVDCLLMDGVYSRSDAKDYYLDMTKDWEDPNPESVISMHEGVRVVRDDYITGSKVRGGDFMISQLPEHIDTIVYCQPRFGLAGVSIIEVAKRYNKKVVLFMPSSKRISHHQACCIERGAEPHFVRIAAMPNLKLAAEKWTAERPNAFYVPLGLKHKDVTAGFVKVASKIKEPDVVWTVLSTGVLHRALQIAWPNAKFHGVAVARNMKAGEVGHDRIISHPLAFTKSVKEEDMPPFPCIGEYDAKGWAPAVRYAKNNTDEDVLFWNVGAEPKLNDETLYDSVDSYRDWKKNV